VTAFRWGIFGTGAISTKFVAGLAAARGADVAFVASRSLERAERFAVGMGIPRAIRGYAEAAAEGGVDAIYIASPPSEHAAHALLCINAGIPVLVEKPLGFTGAQSAQIAAAAHTKSVFVMEAMWTRFLPAANALREKLASRSAGEIRLVTGNFGVSHAPSKSNGIFNPELGGGALSHLGAYPLSLAQWLFGTPTLVQATGTVGPSGVDEDVAFQTQYSSGVIGSFFLSIRAWAPDDFQILGSHGMVGLQGSIVRPFALKVSSKPPVPQDHARFGWRDRMKQNGLVHQLAQLVNRSSRSQGNRIMCRYSGNGYHYEADEVRNCVERGALQSEIMPLTDSIAISNTMDKIRSDVQGHPRAKPSTV
jgi:predicted dehydrogenase